MSHEFKGILDRYNGITVDSQQENCDLDKFSTILIDSLNKWTTDKRRCIWFKVNIKDAAWVPVLANEGFNFHHSRNDFVMMYRWLPKDSPCNLPPACHTNVGVGGMVLNDENSILVVREKHADFIHWKLPGGYVERGEDIKDAAVREVKEETGIEATFDSMITLRHTHNMMFGNSDIYIVVLLRATTNAISMSDTEIEACRWMDIDEFLNHAQVHEFNRFIVKHYLDFKNRKLKLNLHKKLLTVGKFSREVTSMVLEDEL